MKISEWGVREVINTLRQAQLALLGTTALDSPQEFAKKCRENESAVTRAIDRAISILNSVEKEDEK